MSQIKAKTPPLYHFEASIPVQRKKLFWTSVISGISNKIFSGDLSVGQVIDGVVGDDV